MAQLFLMYFSPTHTTKKLVSAVGKIFFERMLAETKIVDLTHPLERLQNYIFAKDDIVIFGAPVYGGSVPPIVLPFLNRMEGNGAKAVILSVYGNRDYDDALLESTDIFSSRGFSVCAAAAFIGEHSYSDLVGTGRPDTEDLLAAYSFGIVAFAKTESGKVIAEPVRGVRPYKELSPFMLAQKTAPAIDFAKCAKCGTCTEVCPTANIRKDLKNENRCIGCGACVKFCPFKARSFTDPKILSAKENLEKNCTARRAPEFFL